MSTGHSRHLRLTSRRERGCFSNLLEISRRRISEKLHDMNPGPDSLSAFAWYWNRLRCMSPAEMMELQAGVEKIHVAPALLDYVQAIVEHTRRSPDYVAGLSPRAALALVRSSRAWALLEGRDKVIPEDVQAILPGVAAHRLRPAHDSARRVDVGAQLLAAVPIP